MRFSDILRTFLNVSLAKRLFPFYIVTVVLGFLFSIVSVEERAEIRLEEIDHRLRTLVSYDSFFDSMSKLDSGDIETLRIIMENLDDLDPSAGLATGEETIRGAPDTNALTELEEKTRALSRELRQVRSMLDPSNLEEILTVTRIGDKFQLLSHRIQDLEGDIEQVRDGLDVKVHRDYQSLDEEIDQLHDTILWLGALVVPLIFVLFLQIQKDRKQDEVPKNNE